MTQSPHSFWSSLRYWCLAVAALAPSLISQWQNSQYPVWNTHSHTGCVWNLQTRKKNKKNPNKHKRNMSGNYHTKSNWFSKWYITGRQQYNGYSLHSKEMGYVCHNTWMCTMLSCSQERLIDSKVCFWWLVSFVLTTVWKINFNRDLLGLWGGGSNYILFSCISPPLK